MKIESKYDIGDILMVSTNHAAYAKVDRYFKVAEICIDAGGIRYYERLDSGGCQSHYAESEIIDRLVPESQLEIINNRPFRKASK